MDIAQITNTNDVQSFWMKVAQVDERAAVGAALMVAASLVCGCAGSQSHLRLLEKDNALSVLPANTPTHDFVVSIRNLKDFGFDPDDKATRDRTALQALESQCPHGRIVGETIINTGTYLLGNPSRTYAIQVKCS